MLSPLSLAKLIETANIKPHDHVLDIGCLTGYSTTLISFLALSIIGIDENEEIVDLAKENLSKLGVNNAKILQSKLQDGYKEGGPYDLIFIQGGVEAINEIFLEQLSEEKGRLITIKYQPFHSCIMIVTRTGATYYSEYRENISSPLLLQFGAQKKFEF
jgi:protein-L-isoaspartate(D-aspartate) O-methyltransferase